MRLSLSTLMKFVSPQQYSLSNKAHLNINTNAVYDFLKVYPPLTHKNKVLDFGCGTGETTCAISLGLLGNLGQPGQIIGLDISQDMIDHCKSTYNSNNMKFQQLDIESTECQVFCSEHDSKFDLVTAFSCLHWVQNQPAAVQFFNRVLKPGGKFLFVISSTQNQQNNALRLEFDRMKREEKWSNLLKNSSWPHFKTVHRNNSWMSTARKDGTGHIIGKDYKALLENNGFKVRSCKELPLNYVLSDEFARSFFKSTVLTSFTELKGEDRKAFFTEYIQRVRVSQKNQKIQGSDMYNSNIDGIQIFGEKL